MRPARSLNAQKFATPDEIGQQLLAAVEHLLSCLTHPREVTTALRQAEQLLEALPMASGEFCTAANRLRNAKRYLQSDERGAARYEVRMLAASLRNQRERAAGPGRRRVRRQA